MPPPGKPPAKEPPKHQAPRIWGDLASLAVVFALLGLVYLLPPDTSLSEVQRIGRLTVCMPVSYPPLVTDDEAAPGFDVELVTEIARRMELRLTIQNNAAMGRDFNPRSWHITRAQCQMLAGGIVQSVLTRSFVDTSVPYLETGWAITGAESPETLEGRKVAFYAGLSGLDRIALGQYLRGAGADVQLVRTLDELEAGLAAGTFDFGVSEALSLSQAAARQGWLVELLPVGDVYPIGLGFWKGDLSFSQRVASVMSDMERDGFTAGLVAKYGLGAVDEVKDPPPA